MSINAHILPTTIYKINNMLFSTLQLFLETDKLLPVGDFMVALSIFYVQSLVLAC